jgi:membrane protease YdiL (CAAX protease family)
VVKTSTSARSPLSPTLYPPEAFRWWASVPFVLALIVAPIAGAAFFLAILLVFRVATLHDLRSFTWPVLASQFAAYAVSLALIAAVLPALAQRPLSALGLRAPRASDLVWGAGGALMMIVLAGAAGAMQELVFHLKADEVQVHMLREARGSLVAGFVFLACFAAPFFEELTFRGVVFNSLLRYCPGWVAIALSAVIFGLAHFQPGNAGAIAPLAVGGVVLATVYYRSGSLVASMFTHSLFNTFTVVLVLVFHQS